MSGEGAEEARREGEGGRTEAVAPRGIRRKEASPRKTASMATEEVGPGELEAVREVATGAAAVEEAEVLFAVEVVAETRGVRAHGPREEERTDSPALDATTAIRWGTSEEIAQR